MLTYWECKVQEDQDKDRVQPDICSSNNCRDETGSKKHGVSSRPNPVSWILTIFLGAYICVLGEPSGLCGLIAAEYVSAFPDVEHHYVSTVCTDRDPWFIPLV